MLEKRWNQIFKEHKKNTFSHQILPHEESWPKVKNDSTNSYFDTLFSFERMLNRYQEELDKKPESLYYQGLVKNTKEAIEKLKAERKV
jgi:hypothetical protein